MFGDWDREDGSGGEVGREDKSGERLGDSFILLRIYASWSRLVREEGRGEEEGGRGEEGRGELEAATPKLFTMQLLINSRPRSDW